MKALLPYIQKNLTSTGVKYEVHNFDSGAFMIDIWINDCFYVIQIDGDMIGLSEVTKDTTPFDIIPDRSFTNVHTFQQAFEQLFPQAPLKKTILLDCNGFSNLDGFYGVIDEILTKDLDWQTGHNLDAFNDLLRGGF